MYNVLFITKALLRLRLICDYVGLMQQSQGTYIYRHVVKKANFDMSDHFKVFTVFIKMDGKTFQFPMKQEMSQSRDQCPQRNKSSIRHIHRKLAVI